MANEGSTKPTCSELEAENLRVRGLLQRIADIGGCMCDDHSAEDCCNNRNERCTVCLAEAELAKESPHSSMAEPSPYKGQVTGSSPVAATTLNSADDGVKPCEYCARYSDRCCHCRNANGMDMKDLLAETTFPQSSSLVSQGAESADIGKLDTTDMQGEPPAPCPACGFPMEWAIANVYDVSREVYYCLHCPAGSAETGGEKAAPQYCKFCGCSIEFTDEKVWRHITPHESHLCPKYGYPTEPASPTSRQSSQNQMVSSGVEGAHAGTTADNAQQACIHCRKVKDAHYKRFYCYETGMQNFDPGQDSREPGKLNNAQKPDKEILNTLLFAYDDLHAKVLKDKGYPGCLLACPHCSLIEQATVALAESSLSSPPPELNMTRADDGRPQFLWFGGKYYTIEHPECMAALLRAIREFPTVSPMPAEPGAESAHSGKQNTADKSDLLPTQLPKEKE